MSAPKGEKRAIYKKVIRTRYLDEGMSTSSTILAKMVGISHQAVGNSLQWMEKTDEVHQIKAERAHYLPPDVLIPPVAIKASRKVGYVLSQAPDEALFEKMLECLSEFYRRKLTMRKLAEYVNRSSRL